MPALTVPSPPPHRLNRILSAIALALAAMQLVAIPLLLLPQAPVTSAVLAIGLSFAVPFIHALMHEAIHGRLTADARTSDRIGRALAISFGVAFDAMRFGHLSHHRFNRHALDRPDVLEPNANPLLAGVGYYSGLLGGIYLREIGASLAMLLPRPIIERLIDRALRRDDPALAAMRQAMHRGLGRRLRRMRFDVIAALALYATAFTLYGAFWPILLAAIALRGLILSLMDNAPHYRTPAIVGADAHNSRAGRWLAAFLLNQNLHAVHHDRPDVPWNALPQAFDDANADHRGGYVTGLLRQFRGPWRPKPAQAAHGAVQPAE